MAVTFTIEPDEFLGLSALVDLGQTADGGGADTATQAKTLMRRALADKLEDAGLPWAPSAEAVKQRAAEAAEPDTAMRRLMGSKRMRKDAAYALAVAVLVALWGGYARGWNWTGFRANGQLWDWLHLLLLPVVIGTIPLWIKNRDHISRIRHVTYAVVIVAWTGFVIAGYLVPLNWTGFGGQTLWDWFELLLLPAALAATMALTSTRGPLSKVLRSLRPYQRGIMAALAAGWIVTVIGGYALRWAWTGYAGNTLWDWLQLLLLPLVFPTILLPALLKWVSGNAAGRASEAHEAVVARIATPAHGTSPHFASPHHAP
jgi:hypothetical protein